MMIRTDKNESSKIKARYKKKWRTRIRTDIGIGIKRGDGYVCACV